MKRFLIGTALGMIGFLIANHWLPPVIALLIGVGIAAVIWLRLYRLDKIGDAIGDGVGSIFD